MHWTLLLYFAVLVFSPPPANTEAMLWRSAVIVLMFGSVLLHEFGHSFAARFCDGESDLIVLWPLGGLAYCRVPDSPMANFLTAAAGPVVSLGLWLGGEFLAPMTNGWTNYCLAELAWLNKWMFLFNLIPAWPMDGGRMLQAILWRGLGYWRATWFCVHLAIVLAIGMIIWVLVTSTTMRQGMMLGSVAGFVLFSAWQQRQMLKYEESNDEYWWKRPGVPFNHPYRVETETKLPKTRKLLVFWRKKEQSTRAAQPLSKEEFIEREVNPVLDKIAKQGMASLTPRERKILEEAGRRMNTPAPR